MSRKSDNTNMTSAPDGRLGAATGAWDVRPMLSRDADAMFWMSRYVERAEHVARLLWVNTNVLVDMGELAARFEERQWEGILSILRLDKVSPEEGDARPVSERVAAYMTLAQDNPNSIITCLTRARENARSIREVISAEMWENLNQLYWSIRGEDAADRFGDSPDDLYRSVMTGSMLFQGLTDQTLAHDQRWLFTQVGKCFERIDVTCRVIATKFGILQDMGPSLEVPIRNIHWMAVLKSCCSIEAYRRENFGEMDPGRVANFLILERDFPRSIRYSVAAAHRAIAMIRTGINAGGVDAAERILGRLDAQLEFAESGEIEQSGVPAYLQKIESSIAAASAAMQRAYFQH
jgi:uncharacterized alpha-E superfamily protein